MNENAGSVLNENHAKLRDYLVHMQARLAYRRAVEKGSAYAFDSVSAGDAAPFPMPAR